VFNQENDLSSSGGGGGRKVWSSSSFGKNNFGEVVKLTKAGFCEIPIVTGTSFISTSQDHFRHSIYRFFAGDLETSYLMY